MYRKHKITDQNVATINATNPCPAKGYDHRGDGHDLPIDGQGGGLLKLLSAQRYC